MTKAFGRRISTLALAAGMLVATAAQADTVQLSGATVQQGISGTVSVGGTPRTLTFGPIQSNAFNVDTSTNFSLISFCLEPAVAGINGTFVTQNGVAVFGAAKAQQLANLMYNGQTAWAAATGTTKATIGRALQLAVWEIAFEPGAAAYSLTSGNFFTSQTLSGARTMGSTFLTNVLNGSWTGGNVAGLTVYGSRRLQDQLGYSHVAAVPEPSTWAMMIFGVGATGFAMRRRRQRALATA